MSCARNCPSEYQLFGAVPVAISGELVRPPGAGPTTLMPPVVTEAGTGSAMGRVAALSVVGRAAEVEVVVVGVELVGVAAGCEHAAIKTASETMSFFTQNSSDVCTLKRRVT